MKLKKSGFIYKVTYNNFFYHEKDKPESENLCKLFWTFLFTLIVAFPMYLLAFSIVTFISFFFARYPSLPSQGSEIKFIPYKKWPTVFGQRIYPFFLIISVETIFILRHLIICMYNSFSSDGLINFLSFLQWPIYLCCIICLFGYLYWIKDKSEIIKLINAYLSAKKQKVCPIIVFESDDPTINKPGREKEI